MRLFWAAVLAAFSLSAAQAHVGPCGPRSQMLKSLADEYGEAPVARGIAGNGTLVELTLSTNGSWSVILTSPGGPTCGVISGRRWEDLGSPPQQPWPKAELAP